MYILLYATHKILFICDFCRCVVDRSRDNKASSKYYYRMALKLAAALLFFKATLFICHSYTMFHGNPINPCRHLVNVTICV